jgi:hypothetical protein
MKAAPSVPRQPAGQAAVEIVALLPLLLLIALVVCQLLAAGVAREAAHHAAAAGAAAMLQGGDPRDAARAASPDWSRRRLWVDVRGRSVRVRVAPPSIIPAAGPMLAAAATASAGPRR